MTMTSVEVNREGNGSNKRLKGSDPFPSELITVDILSSEVTRQIKEQHTHQSPFPHGHIPNIFRPDFLTQVIKEIKDNSVVNFKESDLFKVFQSIDLANLADATHNDTMPSVLKLRSLLYSAEWRGWIENLNDLAPGTLLSSEQVDCACNCHLSGCHLLCHDDVIGTRKVSFIVYLTEADPPWSAVEGGALELYNSSAVPVTSSNLKDDSEPGGPAVADGEPIPLRIPDTVPAKAILPLFNHMAFFVVEPGVSFHAVQEVLGGRPRLSLQGWYHTAQAPSNLNQATLQRLKSYQGPRAVQEEDTEGEFTPFARSGAFSETLNEEEEEEKRDVELKLSADDRDYLRTFLHDTYLQDDALMEIRSRFEQDSSVQLRNFLSEAWVQRLQTAATTADNDLTQSNGTTTCDPTKPEYYHSGVTNNWCTVGPSHKQRFLEYKESTDETKSTDSSSSDLAGSFLHEIQTKLLQSDAFGRFLHVITTLGVALSHRGRVRRFRPGRDYTVAHYGLLTESSVLDATLCFVAGKGGEPISLADVAEQADTTNNEIPSDHHPEVELDADDELWQSGNCGGFECYIAADDEEDEHEAADEYNPEDDTELLSVSASNNTLSIVFRDPGTIRFIKYVSVEAPSSRWDVTMEYEVPGGDDDLERGDEEDVTYVEDGGDDAISME